MLKSNRRTGRRQFTRQKQLPFLNDVSFYLRLEDCAGPVKALKKVSGTLRSKEGNGNENVKKKKATGLVRKTTTLNMHHTFPVHFSAVIARLQHENA